jgi:hypothetical protein
MSLANQTKPTAEITHKPFIAQLTLFVLQFEICSVIGSLLTTQPCNFSNCKPPPVLQGTLAIVPERLISYPGGFMLPAKSGHQSSVDVEVLT